MKKISIKEVSPRLRNSLAILINAILFLLDPPCDLWDWASKVMEVFLFLNVLITSGKLGIAPMLQSHFQKLNLPSIF